MTDKIVQPDKNAKPVSGETEAALKSGGESSGGGYPNEAAKAKSDEKGEWHGGQSKAAYHGGGQFGEREVGEGNQNAPAKTDD